MELKVGGRESFETQVGEILNLLLRALRVWLEGARHLKVLFKMQPLQLGLPNLEN